MNCEKMRTIIDEMIDKGGADAAGLAKEHIKNCENCSNYYNFWLSQVKLSEKKAPVGLQKKIMEKLLTQEIKQPSEFFLNPFLRYTVPSAVLASLLMFVSVKLYYIQTTVPVTFNISYENAQTIALAGDFNDWKSDKILLVKKGDVWEATVRLKPNRYEYMFVIDGEKFVSDPEAQLYADDGFGQKNSVIDITRV